MGSIDGHEWLDEYPMSRRESYFPFCWTGSRGSFAEIWRWRWIDLPYEDDDGDNEGVDEEGGGREGGKGDEEGHDEDAEFDYCTAPSSGSNLAHDLRLEGDPESVRRLRGSVHG